MTIVLLNVQIKYLDYCDAFWSMKVAVNFSINGYSGDLESGLVWILNGQKEVGLEMIWISNGI